MSDLKQIFLEEAGELLAEIEPLILKLEEDVSASVVDELFRVVHTLKGSAGIAGVKGIGELTHRLEDLLDSVRSGELEVRPELVDILLMGFDGVRALLADLAEGDDLPPSEELLELIAGYRRSGSPAGPPPDQRPAAAATEAAPSSAAASGAVRKAIPENIRPLLQDGLRRGHSVYHLTLDFGRDFFRQGHNLSYLLEDLADLGTVAGLEVDASRVPVLSRLNPEDYYLVLTLYLITDADQKAVEETFVFVISEENRVTVRRVGEGELSGTAAAEAQALDGRRPGGRVTIPPEKFPHVLTVLRQQVEALRLADEDVLPGLLPTVRRILGRLAQKAGLPGEDGPAAALDEERRRLARWAGTLLAALDSISTPGSAETAAVPVISGLPEARSGVLGSGRRAGVAPPPASGAERCGGGGAGAFKVRRETADALMSLSGELIVAKSSLPHLVRKLETLGLDEQARELKDRYHDIDRIARDMHERVMDIWLLPVEEVFNRFPRFIRDQAKMLGKKVRVVTAGGDTRLDRNIIEEIYEPLLHLVRNALDHGLEEPEERLGAGKDPTGVIRLTARRQGERVVIQVADDGRGIDVDKLARKAVAAGLVSQERVAGMNVQEKLRLIFLPGLSSKDEISDLSGRGVGMDVVENTVKRLGGTIQVESAPGQGAMFIINLPFTMATSEVLMVRIGGGVYGLPLAAVRETVRVGEKALTTLRGRPVVLLRGEILPLLQTDRCLEACASRREEVILVVLRQKAALPVDAVLGKEVVIVKPLAGELRKLPVFMGAAVLGDGRVLLVLDPGALVRLSLDDGMKGAISVAGGN